MYSNSLSLSVDGLQLLNLVNLAYESDRTFCTYVPINLRITAERQEQIRNTISTIFMYYPMFLLHLLCLHTKEHNLYFLMNYTDAITNIEQTIISVIL